MFIYIRFLKGAVLLNKGIASCSLLKINLAKFNFLENKASYTHGLPCYTLYFRRKTYKKANKNVHLFVGR